jgi:uncharacterized cupredoxin-like copper-binding protein
METRMTTKKLLVAAMALTLILGGLALGQDSTRAEIEAIYAKRQKAILGKEFARLKADLTGDYTEKGRDGTVKNRQQADAEADQLNSLVKDVSSYTIKVVSVEENKDKEIVVETTDSGDFSFAMPDGVVHKLSGKGRQRDIWVRSEGTLKMKFHEELESSVQVDGQTVN